MISEDDIREIFESVGIEATEDQISSVAFDLNTTIEEYSIVPVPMIGVSRQQYEDQSDIICELKKETPRLFGMWRHRAHSTME